MAKRRPKKPMLKFPKRMQKKMIVMFTVVAALMIGLIGRLMYIEYTSGEKYEKIVLAQQGYDSQTIPYQRGDIVDAKGTVLATSIAVYNVILDCSVLNDDEKYVDLAVGRILRVKFELGLFENPYQGADMPGVAMRTKAVSYTHLTLPTNSLV